MRHLLFILVAVDLLGCRAERPFPPDPSPTPFNCDEPGTVAQEKLEVTSRGYAYRYDVYLPPCYEADNEQAYPVLYLIPGRGGGPDDWFNANVNQIANDLILSGEVPPFLIVTTENTSSDPQADAIFDDLLPAVENRYRMLAERPYRAVAGGSLGGVAAYRLVFQHPDHFSSAGVFGSGLIHGEEEQFQIWLDAFTAENQPRVYLNSGEQDPLMLERAQAMISYLEAEDVEYNTLFGPGEHTYVYWASNFADYFRWLALDWFDDENSG